LADASRAKTQSDVAQATYDQAVRDGRPISEIIAAQKAVEAANQTALDQKNALDAVTVAFQQQLHASGIDIQKEQLGLAQVGANVDATKATTASTEATTAGQRITNQFAPQVQQAALDESAARTANQQLQTKQLSEGELNTRIGQLEQA